ncbi:MAG: SWIM zinc finger family protein [Saprospiraceae bacterium]|nr:SWIM zinc finger family protein [Lewinella sp.]
MSPFKLQDLERHLAESVLLAGEDWQATGSVRDLTEVERHLWTAKVGEKERVEVEVQITPGKVRSISCECREFAENDICGHVAATLLELRALINHRKRERDAKKVAAAERAAEKKNKFTLDTVLDEVPTGELLAFVREYARHHRQFSLALKARFTPQVDHIQSREKYAQLLNTAISVSRKADRRISLRGVQKLGKVLEEILFQAEGYFFAAHYTETVDAAGVILEKITPILNKVDNGRDKLEVYLHQSFTLLNKVAIADIPPALKRRLWDYALEESGKLFYRNQSMDVAFFKLLFRLALDEQQKAELLKLLEEHLELKTTQPRSEEELLLIKLRLLEQAGDEDHLNRFFKQNIRNRSLLKKAVQYARNQKDWAAANHWIALALEQESTGEELQEWQKIALEIAQDSGNEQAILPLAMDLFVESGQARYFDLALERSEDSTKLSDEALQRLVLQVRRPLRQEAIATVLSRTNRLDELFRFLEQANSLSLLQNYDHHWRQHDQDKLFPVYRKLVMNYLKDHLGRVTSQKIKNVIDFLYQTGRSGMAERLVEEMRDTYPERHSLMEELDII